MFQREFRRRRPITARYYLYVSKTKVAMLYSQIPRHLVRSLDAEVKASIGVVGATVRRGPQPERSDLYSQAAIVSSYLERHDKVGSVSLPERYIKDTALMKYGVVSEYAADIAFFGGTVGTTRIGLIGSSDSIVGEFEKTETRHAFFYYTLRFLGRLAEQETGESTESAPPHDSYIEAYEIALKAASSPETEVEFLAKVLHQEPTLIIATPIYVALAN